MRKERLGLGLRDMELSMAIPSENHVILVNSGRKFDHTYTGMYGLSQSN